MEINGKSLSNEQTDVIEYIFNSFKEYFPRIEFQSKKTILGIGEPNKHLMCYFSIKDDGFYIKFKNWPALLFYSQLNVSKYIETTIQLFQNNDFLLSTNENKRSKTKNNEIINEQNNHYTYKLKDSIFKNADVETIYQTYISSLNNLSTNFNLINFDNCSTRLRNALYRRKIFNIHDLKSIHPSEILKIKNFGIRCLSELCEFLLKISKNQSGNNSQYQYSSNEEKELDERNKLKYEMLEYINLSKSKSIPLDMTIAFDCYIKNLKEYETLYIEFNNYLMESAKIRLTPREQAILYARLGINEDSKTLQEIGNTHSVTRERIRQLLIKILRKLKTKRLSSFDLIKNEYDKYKLFEKFQELHICGFIAYLYFETESPAIVSFFYDFILNKKIELNFIKTTLNKQYYRYNKQLAEEEKTERFNNQIELMISNNTKRTISDNDFFRLKTERIVNKDFPLSSTYSSAINNETYQCESFLERIMLEKLLTHKTFKYIKTQSIKIPHQNSFYYPDFQCLTHDNKLVIMEIKPILRMCEKKNIDKFTTLKAYCEKYGFGYLIIDDRNNEFFHINELNIDFNTQIIKKIQQSNKINYPTYKQIYNQTKATQKNLLTLIKKHNLKLSFPFNLKQ